MSEIEVTAEHSAKVVAMFAGDMPGRVRECGALGGMDAKSGASGATVYKALCKPLGASADTFAGFSQSTVEKALGAYRLAHAHLSADAAPAQYRDILGAANAQTLGAFTAAWNARIAKANARTDAAKVALMASALKDAAKANAEKAKKAKDAAEKKKADALKAESDRKAAEEKAAEEKAAEGEAPPAPATPEAAEGATVAEKVLVWLSVARDALGALSAAEALSVAEAANALSAAAFARAEAAEKADAEAPAEAPAPKPRAPRAPRAAKVSASA